MIWYKHFYNFRPDGVGSITHEEKEKFSEIKERLRQLLEFQITNFRYCFPFGRPEGALKATLSLLERVLMKDIVTPVPPEEVRQMIKKSLETAAFVNYTRLSNKAKIEGTKIFDCFSKFQLKVEIKYKYCIERRLCTLKYSNP